MMAALAEMRFPPVRGAPAPSYEHHPSTRYGPKGLAWRSIKLLDMGVHDPSLLVAGVDWRFIWMDRDPVDQARSAAEWLGLRVDADEIRRTAASYVNDRPAHLAVLGEYGRVLEVQMTDLRDDRAATLARVRAHIDWT